MAPHWTIAQVSIGRQNTARLLPPFALLPFVSIGGMAQARRSRRTKCGASLGAVLRGVGLIEGA